MAPPSYAQRVTKEQMEEEAMLETRKALKDLMESHPQLFSGQVTPSKVSETICRSFNCIEIFRSKILHI